MRGRIRLGVGATLTAASLVVAGFAMLSVAVSYWSFGQLGHALSVVTQERLPKILKTERLAALSQEVVGAAPTMIAASDPQQKDAIFSGMEGRLNEIGGLIGDISTGPDNQAAIQALGDINRDIRAKLGELNQAISGRFADADAGKDALKAMKSATIAYRALLRPKIEMASVAMTVVGNEVAAFKEKPDEVKPGALVDELVKLGAAAADRNALNDMDKLADTFSMSQLSAAAALDEAAVNAEAGRAKTVVAQMERRFKEQARLFDPDATAAVMARYTALVNDAERSVPSIRARELRRVAQSNTLYAEVNDLSLRMRGQLDALLDDITKRSEEEAALADQAERQGFLLILAVGCASVLVGLASTVFVRVRVLRRFDRLRHCMERLAANDLGVDVPVDGHDEITGMARTLEVFRDTARQVEAATARAEEERIHAAAQRREAVLALADEFDQRIKGLVGDVAHNTDAMHRTANGLVEVARATFGEADTAASASSDASQSISTVAGAAEEMSASIAEIAKRVRQSVSVAQQAVREAERADGTARSLTKAAEKIGEVIALIDSIAARTSLLALNASIEAARAGEDGKGFAVVAGEVKSLAAQTSRATSEIVEQVKTVGEATREMVAAIGEIGGVIKSMDEISSMIASAVEQQDATTRDMAQGIHHVADGAGRAMASITQVTNAAGRVAAAADEMLQAASSTRQRSEDLTRDVDGFLTQIRVGAEQGVDSNR